MQVGIDVGATKIESVVLEDNGNETHRSRTACPKDYFTIINTIKDIYLKLEKEFKKELRIGVCHPGIHSPQTGLVKNAPNCNWLEKKPFQKDLRNRTEKIKKYLHLVDQVIIMTIEPGFGGQSFLTDQVEKIKNISHYIKKNNLKVDIEIDGGVNYDTGKLSIDAGANILVAGSFLFKQSNLIDASNKLIDFFN